MTLIDEGVFLSNDEEVSECFNTYFVNITDTLKIERAPGIPSNIRVKVRANDTNKFAFQASEYSEVWDEINRLSIKN